MTPKRESTERLAEKNILPVVLAKEVAPQNTPPSKGALPPPVPVKENGFAPKVQPKVSVQARKPVERKPGESVKVFSGKTAPPISSGMASTQV